MAWEEECQIFCYEACGDDSCRRDAEDALVDLSKMTPEEMKKYLDSLLQNRSAGF